MRWLRKERDFITLIMVWGLLLQSLVIPFSTTAHAAMLASGSDGTGILCTTRTASPVPSGTFALGPQKQDPQKQSQNGPDCQCCHMACRQSCGGACGGLLPSFAYLVLPSPASQPLAQARLEARAYDLALLAEAQPRAPPHA